MKKDLALTVHSAWQQQQQQQRTVPEGLSCGWQDYTSLAFRHSYLDPSY